MAYTFHSEKKVCTRIPLSPERFPSKEEKHRILYYIRQITATIIVVINIFYLVFFITLSRKKEEENVERKEGETKFDIFVTAKGSETEKKEKIISNYLKKGKWRMETLKKKREKKRQERKKLKKNLYRYV